jgi:hypothetical protein
MFEPADPLEPLKLLANMVAVFADPERAERQIKKFQDAKASAEKAQAGLVTARAKHDAHVAEQEAILTAARMSLSKREVEITQREGRLAAGEARMKEREDADARRSGRIETFHSGMTRERDPSTAVPDPHYPSAA